MKQYLELLNHVLIHGEPRDDRTGTGTLACFGAQLRFDLHDGFPLVTTKRVNYRAVVQELIWFLHGKTNINDGLDTCIWDQWADDSGELGPIYGKQWRSWRTSHGCVDQISQVMQSLKENPTSRRHVVSAWNVEDLPDEGITPQENVARNKMALAPCHVLFQFYVGNDRRLSCQLYQRSADMFLGVPFNIASYSTLVHIMADNLGYDVGEFIYTLGDYHVYKNHLNQVKTQLSRVPSKLPKLSVIMRHSSLFDYSYADLCLSDYCPCAPIKAVVSV